MKKKLFEGSLFTIGASLWWGIIGVIYFKFVSFASPVELTIHRTVWTTVLLVFTTFYFGKWSEFKKVSKSLSTLGLLFITGVLVSINWFTWLYSISVNNMLDASLGYYIFPILSVFLGKIFLKEKINRNKSIAVFLVFLSIIYLPTKLLKYAEYFKLKYELNKIEKEIEVLEKEILYVDHLRWSRNDKEHIKLFK